MSVLCGPPSVWTLPSDVQSSQAERRLHKAAAATTVEAAQPPTDGTTDVDSTLHPSAPSTTTQSPDPAASFTSAALTATAAASQCVLALSVSSSGRLLCALTAHCVWLYSVLGDDCVCLGGWKRSPKLHDEEGDNISVAFNQLSTAGRQHEAEMGDRDDDSDVESDSADGSGSTGAAVSVHSDDEDARDAGDDDSHCVLSVLTSRHVLNVLRVAHRPDLASVAQHHYSASDSGRPHSHASPLPATTASGSQPLQSSMSLSWPSSPAPSVTVSCQSSPCLFGFPSGSWHDAVTVSSAVHQPVSVHLLARVKLSNDAITCVSACRDGFLLGTQGGFVQRVALDGRPVSCMHAVVQVEQQQQQQHETPAVSGSSDGSPALRSLCVSHTLHLLAFVLLDGRVGVCDERLLQPSASSRHPLAQQQQTSGLFAACWLTQPTAATSDAAICVVINEQSMRLAVGWRSGCVQLYHLTNVDGSLAAQPLYIVYPTPPASIPAPLMSTHITTASSSVSLSVESMAYCPSTSTLAVLRRGCGIQLLDLNGQQSSTASNTSVGNQSGSETDSNVHGSIVGGGGGVSGTLALCWSSNGFSLLTNSASTSLSAMPCFARYSVLHVLLPQSAADLSGRLCLLGAGRLHLSKRVADVGLVPSQHYQRSRAGRGRLVQHTSSLASSQPQPSTQQSPPSRSHSSADEEDDEDEDTTDGIDEAAELSSEPSMSSSFDCLLSECEVVCLPAGYASHACPLRCVSVSDSGEHVAVAGSRGLCVWTRRTRKWRQLASLRDEWTLRPLHIAWLADHSIVVHSRTRQLSRQQWADSVPRDRQYQVHQSNGCSASAAAAGDGRLSWSLSSALSLSRSSVSSSSALYTSSPSEWISDIFVFPRSHLAFSSVLCSMSFPVRCRVCDVALSGSTLIVRASQPASLLLQFELTVAVAPPRSSQPHRVSISSNATLPAPLLQPRAVTSGFSQPASASSTHTTPTTHSSLSLPPSFPVTTSTAPASLSPHSSSLISAFVSSAVPSALLPPSWWSNSAHPRSSAGAAASAVSAQLSLQRVDLLSPAASSVHGLHRSARQAVLMPHALLDRHLLLLLSTTGELLCVPLPVAAIALAAPIGSSATSAIWIAARHVSVMWPQSLSTMSPLSATPTADSRVIDKLAKSRPQPVSPLLLVLGLPGLRLIHLQPPQPAQPQLALVDHTNSSLTAIPVALPRDCYPAAVNWRTGCVLTLRSHGSSLQNAPSAEDAATTAPTALSSCAVSLHPQHFLHHLLSACCLPASTADDDGSASTTASSAALLRVAASLLRYCVDGSSAVLLLELMVHSLLVSEESALAGTTAHVAAVHTLLRFLAECVTVPCAYERVLAHVARKTDSSLWSRLFASNSGTNVSASNHRTGQHLHAVQRTAFTGSSTVRSTVHFTRLTPEQLAANCITHRQFHTATLYLLLVQRTDSPQAAHRLAVHIMQQLEHRRQRFTAIAELGSADTSVSTDDVECELHLDKQIRRFAKQTAAIIAEQHEQLRHHPTTPATAIRPAGEHDCQLLIAEIDGQRAAELDGMDTDVYDSTAVTTTVSPVTKANDLHYAAELTRNVVSVKAADNGCVLQ